MAKALDIIALSCGQHEIGTSCTTLCSHIQHYPSENFCQYIKSPYCHIIQICHLAFFSYSHDCSEHQKATITLMNGHSDGHDKTSLRHSSKCLGCLLKDFEKHWKQCTDGGGSYFKEDP
jgi:hypothetical protein